MSQTVLEIIKKEPVETQVLLNFLSYLTKTKGKLSRKK